MAFIVSWTDSGCDGAMLVDRTMDGCCCGRSASLIGDVTGSALKSTEPSGANSTDAPPVVPGLAPGLATGGVGVEKASEGGGAPVVQLASGLEQFPTDVGEKKGVTGDTFHHLDVNSVTRVETMRLERNEIPSRAADPALDELEPLAAGEGDAATSFEDEVKTPQTQTLNEVRSQRLGGMTQLLPRPGAGAGH